MDDTQPFDYLLASSDDAVEGYFMSSQSRLANVERTLIDLLDLWLRLRRDERTGRSILCLRRACPNAPALAASVLQFDPAPPGERLRRRLLPWCNSRDPSGAKEFASRTTPSIAAHALEGYAGPGRNSTNEDVSHPLFAVSLTRNTSRCTSTPSCSDRLFVSPSDEPMDTPNMRPQSSIVQFPLPLRSSVHSAQPAGVARSQRSKTKLFARPAFHAQKQLLHACEFASCAINA